MIMVNKREEINKFSGLIESLVKEKQTSYMDAILLHCEKSGMEVEVAAKLISKSLKTKLKIEAENLNFLSKPKR